MITVTPVITISPSITVTTAVPQMVIDYRADPQKIESGQCSNITWHVENARRVVFGGMEQPFDGSFRVCLDKPATYPLTVTSLSGVEEIYRVSINVIATPTPVPTTPSHGTPPRRRCRRLTNPATASPPAVFRSGDFSSLRPVSTHAEKCCRA